MRTGHIFGSAAFTQYNLEYLIHPVRTASRSQAAYHLFWENLHWIGAFGIV